jgi:serine/threonine protein kinase
MVMELCESGSLKKLLERRRVEEKEAVYILKQIMNGVK